MTKEIWNSVIGALPPNLTIEQVERMFRHSRKLTRKRLSEAGYRWAGARADRLPEWVGEADWSLTNAELARKYKRSRERVRQYRNALGKKKVTPLTGRRPVLV